MHSITGKYFVSFAMSGQNSRDTSRKPSGSSSHSGGHSPSASPGHVNCTFILSISHAERHFQRKLGQGATGNLFGVSATGGLKALNSNWPVSVIVTSLYAYTLADTVYSRFGEEPHRRNVIHPSPQLQVSPIYPLRIWEKVGLQHEEPTELGRR